MLYLPLKVVLTEARTLKAVRIVNKDSTRSLAWLQRGKVGGTAGRGSFASVGVRILPSTDLAMSQPHKTSCHGPVVERAADES